MTIVLDGQSLSVEELARIARHPSVRWSAIPRPTSAWPGPRRSHSVGAGDEVFSADVMRTVLATRLNAFLKGHSGVRRTMVDVIEAMLNRGVIPLVPVQGSVGASGDLCPLSHTFATLLGVGRFYTTSDPTIRDAAELPALLGFDAETIKPTFKEGLALVNGVNFSAAMLALGVYDAERLADVCDDAAARMRELVDGSHLGPTSACATPSSGLPRSAAERRRPPRRRHHLWNA